VFNGLSVEHFWEAPDERMYNERASLRHEPHVKSRAHLQHAKAVKPHVFSHKDSTPRHLRPQILHIQLISISETKINEPALVAQRFSVSFQGELLAVHAELFWAVRTRREEIEQKTCLREFLRNGCFNVRDCRVPGELESERERPRKRGRLGGSRDCDGHHFYTPSTRE
jgi:hypothetical protein